MKKSPEKTEQDKLFLALYFQRRTHKEIAAATGLTVLAVQKRILRHGLRALRDKSEAVATVPKLTPERASEIVKQALSVDLVATAEALPEIQKSKNTEKAAQRASMVQTIAKTAETVFSWNSNGSTNNNNFNFNLLDSCYHVDLAAGTKSRGSETLQLTDAEKEEWRQYEAKRNPPIIIDVPPPHANGEANGHA